MTKKQKKASRAWSQRRYSSRQLIEAGLSRNGEKRKQTILARSVRNSMARVFQRNTKQQPSRRAVRKAAGRGK